jgi:heme-degrading monooxygenase HmoA
LAYASVNVFAVREEDWESFVSLQDDAFVPLLRGQAGFKGFELVRTGPATGVATIWWASELARVAATPALHAWVSVHLDPYFVSLDNPAGPVILTTREQA